MQFTIVALLATVAMAAPAVDIEARQAKTIQACACANAAGVTTTGVCLYGWGQQTPIDGQLYCYPYSADFDTRTPALFTQSECSSKYPLFPNSSCKAIKVCPTTFGTQQPC